MRLENTVNRWILERGHGETFQKAKDLIACLCKHLFAEYEPTTGPNPPFPSRLEAFINNLVDDDDKKLLYRLVARIHFIGRRDFHSLYRTAYTANTTRWLLDLIGVNIFHPDVFHQLTAEIAQTWLCPITDSLDISAFYHVNNLEGTSIRPQFRSFTELAAREAAVEKGTTKKLVEQIMTDAGHHQLVLLEDFVGSGSQIERAVSFAQTLFAGQLKILLCPLLICPQGHALARRLDSKYPNLTYDPVAQLDESSFVSPVHRNSDDQFSTSLRNLVITTYQEVCGGLPAKDEPPYSPFGYKDTGSTTVMYSNCPDNSLPLLHHRSPTWSPIFPRNQRE